MQCTQGATKGGLMQLVSASQPIKKLPVRLQSWLNHVNLKVQLACRWNELSWGPFNDSTVLNIRFSARITGPPTHPLIEILSITLLWIHMQENWLTEPFDYRKSYKILAHIYNISFADRWLTIPAVPLRKIPITWVDLPSPSPLLLNYCSPPQHPTTSPDGIALPTVILPCGSSAREKK